MTKFLVMKSWATGMHTLKTVTGELLAPKMNLFFPHGKTLNCQFYLKHDTQLVKHMGKRSQALKL